MTTENTAIVREYLGAFNDRDGERMRELLAADPVQHGIHEEMEGPEEILELLERHFEVFPDYTGEMERMVADDDVVVVQYSASGTHTGEYRDIEPTGHTVEWTGMAMYRIEDDEIAEIWIEEDRLGLLEQLEAVDPPGHLRI